ncbi:MAG TPA: HPr(Ser) kinase/phosphatase [Verrucomicrobiota bacterium]|nr:HPr(Ser) kinase/phosphatase [Verrucomicrobiota bacterium]
MKRDIVTVEKFYTTQADALGLKLVAGASGLKNIIREPTVNRPGLVLAGHTRYFAMRRIQVMGNAETTYLKTLSVEERIKRYKILLSYKIPCVVFCRNLEPDKYFKSIAENEKVPVFICSLITMKFINLATIALETLFAPRETYSGSMVDILGVGVIIEGESGIGKSECVLSLIERGYSLVSDDSVSLILVDGNYIVGKSPEVIQNFMEVRGIGIIDVKSMFGIRSVCKEKTVDLVVTLKEWEKGEDIERLGMDDTYKEILGIKVPHLTIPVRPGRDPARLVEVAALHIKLKAAGYNTARELDQRIIKKAQISNNHL